MANKIFQALLNKGQSELDFTHARCIFATFKLVPSYSGACMQVHTDGAATPVDIGFDGSGECDWNAIDILAGNNAFIDTWYNQVSGEDFPTPNNPLHLDTEVGFIKS